MYARRILILDFDFYTAIGGGQTFYRRLIERHPDAEFWYPSRGPDCRAAGRGELPSNAKPFPIDQFKEIGAEPFIRSGHAFDDANAIILEGVAAPLQGMAFTAVEVPSFFPVVHLIRPIFGAYGIVLGGISHGLLGWMSVGLRNGYDAELGESSARNVERSEALSVAASDITYAISDLHALENVHYAPEALIDMKDALEDFPPPPVQAPGEGPPDLWFVGRLDRNKGPDLFLKAAAKLPRHLFGRCRFAGPDNAAWATDGTWSASLLELAEGLGLDAEYAGELTDDALRAEVYRGRSVLLVPSRADAFNYVAVEALANGCPIVLSKHAGASDYLHKRCPEIAPPIIDPEDIGATSRALALILESYDESTRALRQKIADGALPRPMTGFMDPVFDIAVERQKGRAPEAVATDVLLSQRAIRWRPLPGAGREPGTAVVVVRDDPVGLAATLASLRRQERPWNIVVVDDGSSDPRPVREVVRSFVPEPALLRQGPQGPDWAANRGWLEAGEGLVWFLSAGDILDSSATGNLAALFSEPDLVAWSPASCPLNAPSFIVGTAATIGPTLVVRRETLDQTGGFRVSLGNNRGEELLQRAAALGRVGRGEGRTMVWHSKLDAGDKLGQTASAAADIPAADAEEQLHPVEA